MTKMISGALSAVGHARLRMARIGIRMGVRGVPADKNPHRSFRLTPRSSYRGGAAELTPMLPSSITIMRRALRLLLARRKTFIILTLLYLVCSWLLIGLPNATQARTVKELYDDFVGADIRSFTGFSTVLFTAITGVLGSQKSDLAQFLTAFLGGIFSLCCIWVARQHLAGNTTNVRQSLYNAPAPLIVVSILIGVMAVQALPASLGAIILSYVLGFQDAPVTGVAGIALSLSALLLMVLSLYIIVPTYIGIVVATLPNTSPLEAWRSARLLTYRRRVPVLKKLFGVALMIAVMWVIILGPIVLLEINVNLPDWLPLMQIGLDAITAITVLVTTLYTYQLYRELL